MSPRSRQLLRPALRRRVAALPLAACLASLTGCAGEDPTLAATNRLTEQSPLTIDTSLRYQHITGFGASSAWTGGNLSEDRADQFFSAEHGLGLSLLRMRIAPDGTSGELATARRAAARGARVWAAPWSPPGEWKTSGTATEGGSLLPEYYEAWADRLAAFAVSMDEAGVPLLALSAQNEPNWTAEWETCVYTPAELVTFVGEYLAPALERDSPGTKLIGPESIDWTTLPDFADALLADPAASAALDIVAVHAYGGTPFPYRAPADNDKEFWETEVSYDKNTGQLATLETAREIYKHLAIGGVNAFHYWWLTADASGSLMRAGELEPQAYGLGHYSKFVRPGYVRVDASSTPRTGLWSSAYYDPESHRTVLVVVNESKDDVSLELSVEGAAPLEVEPWVTSESAALSPQPRVPFEPPFSYDFGAATVTSLVFSETISQAPAGEGGAPSVPGEGGAGGRGEAPGSAGDTSAAGAEQDPQPNAGGQGGSNMSSAGSAPNGIAPRRAAYLACSAARPTNGSSPITLFAGYAMLTLWRRRGRFAPSS